MAGAAGPVSVPDLWGLVDRGRQRGYLLDREIEQYVVGLGTAAGPAANAAVLQGLFEADVLVISSDEVNALLAALVTPVHREAGPEPAPTVPLLVRSLGSLWNAARFWASPLLLGLLAAVLLYFNWWEIHRAPPLPPSSISPAASSARSP